MSCSARNQAGESSICTSATTKTHSTVDLAPGLRRQIISVHPSRGEAHANVERLRGEHPAGRIRIGRRSAETVAVTIKWARCRRYGIVGYLPGRQGSVHVFSSVPHDAGACVSCQYVMRGRNYGAPDLFVGAELDALERAVLEIARGQS